MFHDVHINKIMGEWKMKRILQVGLAILFTLGMLYGNLNTAAAASVAPEPVLVQKEEKFDTFGKGSNGNEENPGEWYRGATPDNLRPDAPILLFVPGLNNIAQIFWEDNNMYQTAHDAGYQTAFLQLYDAGGESADMWDNGSLLASKIREISNYYNGKDITIIAYSKGGVDTQTALTYYDASQYVDNVITLSSPHHGSQLADLAYSSGAGWLADLIGAQGEGTAAMQTAYMSNFRSETDAHANAYLNDYFTLGGTSWGTMFSANWFGGMYLSSYGPNDGVVTAASSNLPGGDELAIGDWNHTSVRTGETFPVFMDYLSGDQLFSAKSKLSNSDQKNNNTPETNRWVEGGPLGESRTVSLQIEENVEEMTIQLLTADELSNLKITDPLGETVEPEIKEMQFEEGVFKGAIGYAITIAAPAAGEWKVNLRPAAGENAYLLVADFKTEEFIYVNQAQELGLVQANKLELEIDPAKVETDQLTVAYEISETANPDNKKTWKKQGKSSLTQTLHFDKKQTVYTITIHIEGKTKKGNTFKRTIIDSIYAN